MNSDRLFICTYNHDGTQYILENVRDPQISNHCSAAGGGFGYLTFTYRAPDMYSDVLEINYAYRVQVWLNAFALLFDGEIRKIQEQTARGKRELAVSATGYVCILEDDIFDFTFTENRYTRWRGLELSTVIDMCQFWDNSAGDYAYIAGEDADLGFKRYCAPPPIGGSAPPAAALWEQITDLLYIGCDSPFFFYHAELASGGVYGAVTHEYYDGASWQSVIPLTDTTNGWAQTGHVMFHELQMPEWARYDIKGDELYWLRLSVSSVTTVAQLSSLVSPLQPEKFNYDLDNRLFIAPNEGASMATGDFSYIGTQLITNRPAPPLAAANMHRVTFSYDVKIEDAWILYCRHYNGAAFTDYDTNCKNTGAGTFTVLQDTDDVLYFGHWTHFPVIWIEVHSAGTGIYSGLTWEYWNGSAWTEFEIELDDTENLAQSGIIWWGELGADWARTTVDTMLAYWIRVRAVGVTTAAVISHLVFHPLTVKLVDGAGTVLWTKSVSETGTANIVISNDTNYIQLIMEWTAADGDNFATEGSLFAKLTDVVLFGVSDSTVTPELIAETVLTVASASGHDLSSSTAAIEATGYDISPAVFDEHASMAHVLSEVCSRISDALLVWGVETNTMKRLYLRVLDTATVHYFVLGERIDAAAGGDLTASWQAVFAGYVDELEREQVLDSAQNDTVIATIGGRFRRTFIDIENATAAQAAAARDLYLAEQSRPAPAVSYTVKDGDVWDSAGHSVALGEMRAGVVVCLRDYRARETIGNSADIRNNSTIFMLAAVEYAADEGTARLIPAEDKSGFEAYLDYIAKLRRQ